MTRQEIVHELIALRELNQLGNKAEVEKIAKRVEEAVAEDAIEDTHGRRFQ